MQFLKFLSHNYISKASPTADTNDCSGKTVTISETTELAFRNLV